LIVTGFISYLGSTAAEGMLTKAGIHGIHVWHLKKLLCQNSADYKQIRDQCVIEISGLMCCQDFIIEHSNLNFNCLFVFY